MRIVNEDPRRWRLELNEDDLAMLFAAAKLSSGDEFHVSPALAIRTGRKMAKMFLDKSNEVCES